MKKVNTLEDFIKNLRLLKPKNLNKLNGVILEEFRDSCGKNYDIVYSYNDILEFKENIRLDYDDRETPEFCINEKIRYIQNQLKVRKK